MKRRNHACRVSLQTLLALALCVPAFTQDEDASEEEVPRGLRIHEEGAFEGYTLFAPLKTKSIFLIDMKGAIVHRWDTEHSPTGAVYLLDNGHLLRCARAEDNPVFDGGGIGGHVQEFNWEGELVWQYTLADELQTQHHDIEPLPNGNVLLITWEKLGEQDAVALGRDPEQVGGKGLWPDAVLEIKPTYPEGGEIVWEWHAWDHLIQDLNEDLQGYDSIPDHPERIDINADHRDLPPITERERIELAKREAEMRKLGYTGDDEDEEQDEEEEEGRGGSKGGDWLHTNGIDYNAEYDLIVLSTPELNELWIIDHSTDTADAADTVGGRFDRGGDLLFRWGNPRNYGKGSNRDRRLFYQHNPVFVEGSKPGELRLLVFNNGGGRPGDDYSSVEELLLPFDPKAGFQRDQSEAFGPAEPIWSYSDPGNFFSSFISGAQRLPNGNTLICSGAPGRLLEVTTEGRIVWEYLNEHGPEASADSGRGGAPPMALFRATRIAPIHPGLKGRL